MKKLLILIILFQAIVFSQVVYEPLHRDVYDFLSRISQKGLIELSDQFRPLTRKYIAEKLIKISQKQSLLTDLQKDELDFFVKDFKRELDFINDVESDSTSVTILSKDYGDRLRLFAFRNNFFTFNLSPILGASIGSRDNVQLTHFWNGIYTYGYIGDYLGFSFDFRDNLEKGNNIDKIKDFTPVTGINPRTDENIIDYPENKMEYNEVKATISTNWDWGSFTVGKDFVEWGYGKSGLLVLSQKAPSFPFIRLNVTPVDWLDFSYIHGWLFSDVLDSNNIYKNTLDTDRINYRSKFLASHSLTFKPFKGFTFSLGESIVYSDQIEFLYLIPIMFFRLADHYLSRNYNAAGGNAQFFASVSSRNHIKNTHLYGTIFIDEITLNGITDSYSQRNQLGFTLGGSVTDLPIENLTATIEYSKIFPYVYRHYIQTTTYESYSYVLGHWMRENADQIFASLNYRFLRGLQATVWGQYIRKGEEGSIEGQYVQPQPPFLFGLRKNYTYFGAEVKYEFVHELFAKLQFQNRMLSQEQSADVHVESNLPEFYFSVYYGL